MDDREFERARDVYQRISAPEELRERVLKRAASAASAASTASTQEAGTRPDVKAQSKAEGRSGGLGDRWKKTYYGGALAACLAVFVFLWGVGPAGLDPVGMGPAGEADMVYTVPDGNETKDSAASLNSGQAAGSDETKVQDRAGSDQNREDPASDRAAQAQDRSPGGTDETAAAGNKQKGGSEARTAEPEDARTAGAAPVDAKASKAAAARAAKPEESVRDAQNGVKQEKAEGLISGQAARETGEGAVGKTTQAEKPCDESCKEPCDGRATAQAMESSEGRRREFDVARLIHRRQFFDDTWTNLPREDGRTKTERKGEND